MKPVLALNKLSVGFEKLIFENITAQVMPGNLIAVTGVNGIGKSCLLKTISGVNSPMSGEIFFEQKKM